MILFFFTKFSSFQLEEMSKQQVQDALGEISSVQEEIEKALQRKSKAAAGDGKFILLSLHLRNHFVMKFL